MEKQAASTWTRAIVFLACVSYCPHLGAQAAPPRPAYRVETYSAPLLGSESSPSLEGGLAPAFLEAYDDQGRLVLLGRTTQPIGRMDPEAKAGEADGKGRGAGSALPKGNDSRQASSSETLTFTRFRYDRSDRLIEIQELPGPGLAPTRAVSRRFDETGSLVEIVLRESVDSGQDMAESARLRLLLEGSGRAGSAVLVDSSGRVVEAAELRVGGGAAPSSLEASVFSGDGEDAGAFSIHVDAGGRLSALSIRRPAASARKAEEAAAPGEAPSAGKPTGEAAAPAGGAAPAEPETRGGAPRILSLLGPLWPGEGPGLAALFGGAPGATPGLGPQAPPSLRTRAGKPSLSFEAGLYRLPFEPPEEGSAEFLYDAEGRLISAELFDSDGAILAAAKYRYDARGLLIEEDLSALPKDGEQKDSVGASSPASAGALKGKAPSAAQSPVPAGAAKEAAPGQAPSSAKAQAPAAAAAPVTAGSAAMEGRVITHQYLLGPNGIWKARSSFLRLELRAGTIFSPYEYRERIFTPSASR